MATKPFLWTDVGGPIDILAGRLNLLGRQLQIWMKSPTMEGYVVRPKEVIFATTATWQPGKDGQTYSFGALTNNTTITLDGLGLADGAELWAYFVQDGTGGRTVTFAASTGFTVAWGTTGFVAMGATASKVTIYTFHFKGTTFHGAQFTKNS